MKRKTPLTLDRRHIFRALSYLFVFSAFCGVDFWLRIMVRGIDRYSLKAIEPNLFTAFG